MSGMERHTVGLTKVARVHLPSNLYYKPHQTTKLQCFFFHASQLSLSNLLKPGVKSRMKMQLEQRRQAMLQLHLSDQQIYCLLWCTYITGLTVLGNIRQIFTRVHMHIMNNRSTHCIRKYMTSSRILFWILIYLWSIFHPRGSFHKKWLVYIASMIVISVKYANRMLH